MTRKIFTKTTQRENGIQRGEMRREINRDSLASPDAVASIESRVLSRLLLLLLLRQRRRFSRLNEF
jgi:hypothetical protein